MLALARFRSTLVLMGLVFKPDPLHGNAACIMAKHGTTVFVNILRRQDFGGWWRCNNDPGFLKQSAILIVIGFIRSDKFDVKAHGLSQFDQERKKVTVMVVCRGQE